jgi:hypothetical protein
MKKSLQFNEKNWDRYKFRRLTLDQQMLVALKIPILK